MPAKITYERLPFSANSAALREMSSARRASPEAAETFLAINSTASGSNDTKFSSLVTEIQSISGQHYCYRLKTYLEEMMVCSCFTL